MGTPIEQGVDLVRLATEEDYVFSQHLYKNRLFGANIFLEYAGIRVLREPHGRHIFKWTERGSALRLPPGHLGVTVEGGAMDGAPAANAGCGLCR